MEKRFTKKEEKLILLVMENLDKIEEVFDLEAIEMDISIGDFETNIKGEFELAAILFYAELYQRNIYLNGKKYYGILNFNEYDEKYMWFHEEGGEERVFKLMKPLVDRKTGREIPKKERKWIMDYQKPPKEE